MMSTKIFWFAIALTVLAGCGDPKRKQALEEIRELETKRVESENAYEQLKKFRVLHAQFIMREQEFNHKQPIIMLNVKNETEQTVSRVYFEGVLASPGQKSPWYRDRFNHIISGGLGSGEEATWYLEPNMFSGWAKTDAPTDAALTVTVEEIDGADGKSIYLAREFTGRDRERLDALKKKYDVEYKQVIHALRHDDRKAPLSAGGQKDKDKTGPRHLSFVKTLPDNTTGVIPVVPGPETETGPATQISARAANGVQEPPAPTPAAEKPDHKPPLYQPSAKNKTLKPSPAAVQPVPPAAAQPTPKASESTIYTLQLGSFKSKNAASSFSRSLSAKGYKPHIVKITTPDKDSTYRVRLGKYKNIKDAREMVAALKKKADIPAIIISK